MEYFSGVFFKMKNLILIDRVGGGGGGGRERLNEMIRMDHFDQMH